ncbi:tripartite tricarboxylate transporter substrate binding protein, partial [uncultured Bosea sp.]|uniref:Bug family tripartite tricarboxylate transporter substrate binding protein n=1 Tax=uncultured Bosea sp. TaxID=211457 RepID=UPI0025FB3098
PKLDYNIQTDFIPIAVIAQPPQVIVVNPGKVQAKTVAELVDFARKNPEKLNFASAGNGTTHHLAGELFQISTKTKLTHVPYRGAGPALQDTVAGQVDLLFDGLGSSAAQIQSGTLRALAVAAPARSDAVPDVPTAKEAGLEGFEVSTWYALWAPKGTSPEIVSRMRDEVQKVLKTPAIEAAWKKNGSPMPTLAGDDFGKFVTAEVERWGKVVKEAQVKLE